MQMLSTRGAAAVTPSMAILRGLAPDGGLYVPASFPAFTLSEITAMADMTYQQRAYTVLSRFLPDFEEGELKDAIAGAYGTGFDCEAVAPMAKVGSWAHALELWHGPTLAFKDMALQLLPYLLTLSGKKHGETREVFILVATSGDTGKAALEGFMNELMAVYEVEFGGSRNAIFRLKENWGFLHDRFEGCDKLWKRLKKSTDPVEFKAITDEIFHTLPLR